MSTPTRHYEAATVATLADALASVATFKVAPQAQRNMASAINTLCAVLNQPPSAVPLLALELRKLFNHSLPAGAGVKPARWRNVKSDVKRAVRLSGLTVEDDIRAVPLTPAWEAAIATAPGPVRRSTLRRLARFCCARQVQPDAVSDQVMSAFAADLEMRELSKVPARIVGDVIRIWNKYTASALALTPVTVENRRTKYAIDWTGVLPSLAEDAAEFRAKSVTKSLFGKGRGPLFRDGDGVGAKRSVRESTAQSRDRHLRRLVAAEIAAGVSADLLRQLGDVIQPVHLERGLEWMRRRNPDGPLNQIEYLANLAVVIARDWAKFPAAQIERLIGMARDVHRKPHGMTDKNRGRLRQFGTNENLATLYRLPAKLFGAADRETRPYRAAVLAQMAVAIGILIFAPIRIGNLLSLDRSRHFVRGGAGAESGALHMFFAKDTVKNDVDLEFPLPAPLVEWINRYMRRHQPALTNGIPSAFLFPGRNGTPKVDTGFRTMLIGTIRRETGLVMNPHLFRHLQALMFLRRNPGHYEEVRRFLGQKNIQTTIQFYAGMETADAVRRLDEAVLDIASSAPATDRRKG